jgi:hypothetical protein
LPITNIARLLAGSYELLVVNARKRIFGIITADSTAVCPSFLIQEL